MNHTHAGPISITHEIGVGLPVMSTSTSENSEPHTTPFFASILQFVFGTANIDFPVTEARLAVPCKEPLHVAALASTVVVKTDDIKSAFLAGPRTARFGEKAATDKPEGCTPTYKR
jgi:hypothetical protein